MRRWGLLTAGMIGLSGLATMAARNQSQAYSGDGDYKVYCSSCHGAGGKGDGSIAPSLKKHPPDLTQLTKRNNGVFPTDAVFKNVDSRQPGSAHGDSDMPAWGDVFAKSADSPGADNAAVRIRTMVMYLETIQAIP